MRFNSLFPVISTCILAVVIVTACLPQAKPPLPLSTQNVPSYPGSQNVHIQNMSKDPAQTWQLVEFDSRDSASVVLAYYADKLSADGWYSSTKIVPQIGKLSFTCCDTSADNSLSTMTVEAQEMSDKQTKVKVELYEELPF